MRKGFTLVELLIAIVIIAILSSGLLLSGSSATSTARAIAIVTDLQVMKEAALLWSIDSMDYFDTAGANDIKNLSPKTVLAKYVDNPEKYDRGYGFDVSEGNWYVSYTIGNIVGADDIKSSLAGRAAATGLLNSPRRGDVYKGGDSVYMLAR